MESESARRRVHVIASHFAARSDISAAAHLLPMSCSGSLNSVIRRCDNMMYFARQASDSQGSFMRQVSNDQSTYSQPGMSTKCPASEESRDPSGGPLFSRPLGKNFMPPRVQSCKTGAKNCNFDMLESPPQFGRPSRKVNQQRQMYPEENINSKSTGTEWSPRMDVAESRRNYVMIVEIPGVNVDDLRVEVDNKNLTVTGKRANLRAIGSLSEPLIASNRREILQGPYKLVWPLPTNVNKDRVSAEFWNGVLQIIIPKH